MSDRHVETANLDHALECYVDRRNAHRRLRSFFDTGAVVDYVNLALGITSAAGNYSADRRGIGPQILSDCGDNHRRIFEFAGELDRIESPNEVVSAICGNDIPHLGISVGSEMAMMLRPDRFWVDNRRTIWASCLLRHARLADAKAEFTIIKNEHDQWKDLYSVVGAAMVRLREITTDFASEHDVALGQYPNLWSDSVSTVLYSAFIEKDR